MTGVVGVHVTPTTVWCAVDGRVHGIPAAFARVSGSVVFGTAADRLAEATAIDIYDRVDDESVDCGGSSAIATVRVLSELVADALGSVAETLPAMVITCPPHWGETRRLVVRTAASHYVRHLSLVTSAEVAVHASGDLVTADPQRVLVLDRTPHRTTVTDVVVADGVATVTGCRLVDPVVTDERDRGALLDALSDVFGESTAPARVLVHGPDSPVSTAGLRQIVDVPLVVLEDEEMARAAGEFVTDERATTQPDPHPDVDDIYGGPVRSAAWLGRMDLNPAPRRRLGGRLVAAVGAGVALIVAAAFAVTGGGGLPRDTVAHEVTDTPRTSGVAVESAPPTEPAVFRLGELQLTVPVEWYTSPGTERVLLRPDDGSAMRIVVVSRELAEGTTEQAVVDALAERVAVAEPGRFDPPVAGDIVAGLPALSYVERPADGTTVRWSVLVTDRLQTSIGCQSSADLAESMTAVCSDVLASVVLS